MTIKHNYVPQPKSFAEDTWETIAENTSSDVYNVGDTRQVLIDNKTYTVRIANKSTPTECNDSNFSQTACGFVVEFVNIVENRQMKSTSTNIGGWKDSAMRTYANGDFFNNLPEDLRNVIKATKVVSGHGSDDNNAEREDGNWESEDKIYLLSAHEVWEDKIHRDTAYNQTRQLDYYKNLGVNTISSKASIAAMKKTISASSGSSWWLRAADYYNDTYFLGVAGRGGSNNGIADSDNGFAPAFRIG